MANPIPEPTIVYPIGTQFTVRRSHAAPLLCTVSDILRTTNAAGELVRVRYEATHPFVGRLVTDHDVVAVTIAKGLVAR